jgi:hypothetical protein
MTNLPITPFVEMFIPDTVLAAEGFEGTGPPYAFATSTSGSGTWAPSTSVPFYQTKSLKSPVLINGQAAEFNMVAPTGSTKVRLWHKLDAGTSDLLRISVNGTQVHETTASGDWDQFEYPVAGGQTVQVRYIRNVGGGSNAAYVDYVEFLQDAWVDITDDIRLDSAHTGGGIDIKRGRPNESPIAEPTECDMVINNATGKWSELNPAGQYFGRIGRNQPVRVSLRRIRDDFNHTEVNTWGSTPTWVDAENVTRAGYAWNLIGTAANFDMGSGLATIQAVAGTQTAHVSTFADVDVLVKVKVSDRTSQFGVMLRTNSAGTQQIRAGITPGATDKLTIGRIGSAVGWAFTTDNPFQVVAGTWYWLRAQVTGLRYRMKFWKDGDVEPTLWGKTYADDRQIADGTLVTTGGAGCYVRDGTALVTYELVEMNVWRAHTEVVALPVKFDLSRTDRWVPFKTRGILRRLGQGRKALDSALTHHLGQYLTGSQMWIPFETTIDGTTASNAVVGGIPAIVTGVTTEAPELTGNQALPGVSGVAHLTDDTSYFLGQAPNHPNVNQAWTLLGFFQVDALPASKQLLLQYAATGTGRTFNVYVDNSGNIQIDVLNGSGTIIDTAVNAVFGSLADFPVGVWVASALYVFDSAGTVTWAWNNHRPEPGKSFYSMNGSYAGTAGVFKSVSVTGNSVWTAAGGIRLAQFFHYSDDLPFVTYNFSDAACAYRTETNIARFTRLCGDAGITYSVVGDTNSHGHQMGAQLPQELLTLLTDCADVGGFNLEEDRDDFGLVLRSRQSIYNGPQLLLDVDAGHLSDPLDPAPDDQATRNDVTVKRVNGGFARSIQTSGDMNINPPETDPDGVGVYDESPEYNYYSDSQLQAHANWRRSMGTLKVPRYPNLSLDLTSSTYDTSLATTALALALDSGALAEVANPEAHPGSLPQIIQSYTESIDQYDHDIQPVTFPGNLYVVGVMNYTTRVEPASIITADPIIVGTTTSFKCRRTDTTTGLWVPTATDAAVANFDIMVAGVQVHVNTITGSSDPQTININAAPVNDVDTGFTITPGQRITLADPWRIAW